VALQDLQWYRTGQLLRHTTMLFDSPHTIWHLYRIWYVHVPAAALRSAPTHPPTHGALRAGFARPIHASQSRRSMGRNDPLRAVVLQRSGPSRFPLKA
jgi:hypothetical protein